MPLIVTLAAALGLALVLGFIAAKARLPAMVGYLLAGVILGPGTPGFVADVDLAAQLAEIGVMLLMFGVGLHFSIDDLLSVKRIAVPGAVVQMGVATLMGLGVTQLWGWSIGAGLVFGLALSVASTVVLLRALESRGVLESSNGRIAVGWLVVEDLATVLVLVLLPPLAGLLGGKEPAGGGDIGFTIARTLAAVAAFVALMLLVGRRLFPWLLWQVTKTGSRELFTLCVVAAAVTIAYGSSTLFGVSFALGAFFAGMVLRESEFSHRAAEESLPLRDAFAVLFFVSVGMLFDPRVLITHPLQVLATAAIVLVGKSLAAALLVLAMRYPLNSALTVSAGLAQIGEFSFILVALGLQLQLVPPEAQSYIVAGALISITLNPLVFSAIEPIRRWVLARSAYARRLEQSEDPLSELPQSTDARYLARQVVVVGYGRVGKRITEALLAQKTPLVVAERNRERVEELRARGVAAVMGDAADPMALVQAHIANARALVIATPQTIDARQMIETARTLNPGIQILVRAPNEEEARLLQAEGHAQAFVAEQELSAAMLHQLQQGAPAAARAVAHGSESRSSG
jgi:CPA2 family monovalent cation:H+ antiporter-2